MLAPADAGLQPLATSPGFALHRDPCRLAQCSRETEINSGPTDKMAPLVGAKV